jgi:hypothetical protein
MDTMDFKIKLPTALKNLQVLQPVHYKMHSSHLSQTHVVILIYPSKRKATISVYFNRVSPREFCGHIIQNVRQKL